MMHRSFALALVALAGLAAGTAPAQTAYTLGDDGVSLLTFSISNPTAVNQVAFFGGADVFVDSLDFRPATGELFAYQDDTDSYFRVNTATGELTRVSAAAVGAATDTNFLGMDFNPTIDRLRVVTQTDQNVVYNPNTGTAAAFTALAYAAGDVNQNADPLVIENAYTNNRPEAFAPGQTTVQYVLDYGTDSLAVLANNLGTLTTVGQVRVGGAVLDFDFFTGFDIFTTQGGADTAYALLRADGVQRLYAINLTDATATDLGVFGDGSLRAYGLAVTPVSPVPVPPTLIGVAGGVMALGLRAARRRVLG